MTSILETFKFQPLMRETEPSTTRHSTGMGLFLRTLRNIPPGQLAHLARHRLRQAYRHQFPERVERKFKKILDEEWPRNGVRPRDQPLPREFFEWMADERTPPVGPSSGKIRVLNQDLPLDPNGIWERIEDHPPLVIETVHYHRFLYEWIRGRDLTDTDKKGIRYVYESWKSRFPLGRGRAWDPFTVAYRCQVWVRILLESRDDDLLPDLSKSLFAHGLYLEQNLEFHLGGNHLWKDLVALLMLSGFFQGPTADRWFGLGRGLLEKEIEKQILSDGGHYERSAMYHVLVLGDLLDVRDLLSAVQPDWIRSEIEPVIGRMAGFLDLILHPDGEVPFFNDSVLGQAPAPYLALKRTGRNHSEPNPIDASSETGIARLTWKRLALLFDGGRLGPDELMGHVHNDTLSIEVSLGSERMIVNRGVYEYTMGGLRQKSRSIHSHNTPCLDEFEQSEIWSSFRVGSRWRPSPLDVNLDKRTASSSWSRPGMSTIRRTIRLTDDGIEVRDEFTGKGRHRLTSPLHFAAGVTLKDQGMEAIEGRKKWTWIATKGETSLWMGLDLPDSLEMRVEESTWWPRFYVEERIQRLMIHGDIAGEQRLTILLKAEE